MELTQWVESPAISLPRDDSNFSAVRMKGLSNLLCSDREFFVDTGYILKQLLLLIDILIFTLLFFV